jgi:hypothetical protein
MKLTLIAEAKSEALRFLQRVAEYEKSRFSYEISGHTCFDYGVKESGALRRASMDLTRVLAKMRRCAV